MIKRSIAVRNHFTRAIGSIVCITHSVAVSSLFHIRTMYFRYDVVWHETDDLSILFVIQLYCCQQLVVRMLTMLCGVCVRVCFFLSVCLFIRSFSLFTLRKLLIYTLFAYFTLCTMLTEHC